MKQANMIFTRYAHWYCDVLAALGREDRLRTALVVVSPHDRRFIEFPRYEPFDERLRQAAETVVALYQGETWHRRPRVIHCGTRELTGLLVGDRRLDVAVRTDSTSGRLTTAQRDFEEWVSKVPRRGGWSSGVKLKR